ncbi:NADH-quinone oxidoreductase subunit C [Paenibacillus mendelii]|uniref:NADH-quinone oxidoreductase subunit C n=1 Tax=Paenibacillus mendelii TaxID=206163 RepID=A0ABV6J3J5_9BACL|nr:NADH-quinone oxidoreductase subunit C [Paenibacillus mendelii]MCQ6561918.1 NADH-quinone oxidoreductase subunit C [Paenibacillus mendelii]
MSEEQDKDKELLGKQKDDSVKAESSTAEKAEAAASQALDPEKGSSASVPGQPDQQEAKAAGDERILPESGEAHEQSVVSEQPAANPEREAKLKAAAEARAARAELKVSAATPSQQQSDAPAEEGSSPAVNPEREAKMKAAAEARAARAAAKAAAEGGEPAAAPGDAVGSDPEREAKQKAAAEARAARAAAKAASEAAEAPAEPKPPSPKQPQLDETVELVRSLISEQAVEEAYINELNDHMPIIVVGRDHWQATANLLRTHDRLQYGYLRNVSGIDFETHMEVVYHLVSIETKRELAVKLRADREAPSVPSATPVWATANWNEREIYDLLGVDFPGHPDMRRIMMPDEWVGHPLRKDYEPLDPEV